MAGMDTRHTALVVIDVQKDFCAGGELAVPDGDSAIPVINWLIPYFPHVVLTQDWHPSDHASFASQHPGRLVYDTVQTDWGMQTLWPNHCVQGTRGAKFSSALKTDPAQLILRKGFRREIDSYSAFYENDKSTATGLAGWLRERGLEKLCLVGLATDYCVAFSALDARREGFECSVILDGCRAIDLDGSLDTAMEQMRADGVTFMYSQGIHTDR